MRGGAMLAGVLALCLLGAPVEAQYDDDGEGAGDEEEIFDDDEQAEAMPEGEEAEEPVGEAPDPGTAYRFEGGADGEAATAASGDHEAAEDGGREAQAPTPRAAEPPPSSRAPAASPQTPAQPEAPL
jgi:hypothetical protein